MKNILIRMSIGLCLLLIFCGCAKSENGENMMSALFEPDVMLADLEPSVYKHSSFEIKETFTDYMGNIYENAVNIERDKYGIYQLDGEYKKISGTATAYWLKEEFPDSLVWFEIYGDDELLYTSPDFSYGIEPVEFEVDLRGVDE